MKVVLLPGLDGTGDLFQPFVQCAPPRFSTEVIAYPIDKPHGYDDLKGLVESRLPSSGRYMIVAESFSSPLGAMLARSADDRLRALVIVGGFLRRPVTSLVGFLPLTVLFAIRPPAWLLRRYALDDAPDHLHQLVRGALERVSARVLAARVREVLRVDCREVLSELRTPVLYLRGSRDRLVGERSRIEVADSNPAARLVELDAPHFVLQHSPRAAWGEIERFLAYGPAV